MLIVFQLYCIFIAGIAIILLPGQLLEMFKHPSWGAFGNLQFTVLTIFACAVIVGLIQVHNITGIF